MRRLSIVIAGLALLAPAGARADEPATSCGPLTCVSVHGHVEVGCDIDGRDVDTCVGAVTFNLAMDSPVPFESMDFGVTLSCSVECQGSSTADGTCGWEPGEVRPIGETGCVVDDVRFVSFPADVPAGTCQTYQVSLGLAARARLDPVPSVATLATNEITICR